MSRLQGSESTLAPGGLAPWRPLGGPAWKGPRSPGLSWVLAKDFNLTYQNKERVPLRV